MSKFPCQRLVCAISSQLLPEQICPLLLSFLLLFFLLAHCFFFPVTSFLLLVPDWINRTITYFPNTCILTCPLLLSFLLLFFLLAHCFFFPVTLFILLPKWTVTFFPVSFFPHLSTVTFIPVTFFPTCPLLLSFLLPFYLLLSFRAPVWIHQHENSQAISLNGFSR